MKKGNLQDKPIDVDKTMKEIGLKIRMHRKSVNNNYEQFAKEYKLSKVTLARIENGENFTLTTLIQILRILNIPLEDFFKGIK
jgi:transcriptional regulator with XRE-family HTH domain